ncbi:MAG TPA: helix-turn-helix domain-containing protein [Nitrosopumilaceae archaeon]|jgi:predicted DNA-binding transcriptional regulator AlpA|nr:helix-turn-helix domain-containing protein [Nitrosopumilaceae archaeon]
MADKFLTITEVMQMFNLSRDTLSRYRVSGTGPPFIKIGGSIRYRRKDIRKWIKQNTFIPKKTLSRSR